MSGQISLRSFEEKYAKVAMCGFYGAGNTGDEAILSAIINSVRRKNPDTEFTVLSLNPAETEKLHKVKAIFMPPFGLKWITQFKKILEVIKNSDIVVIGGGGLLQDAHNYFAIPRYVYVAILAKSFKKPLMFYSVGVGPIKNWIEKILVRVGCNLSDIITVRDKPSKELLLSLGVRKAPIIVSADPVFALQSINSKKAEEILRKEGVTIDRPLIGVSVRKTEWHQAEIIDDIAKLLDYAISRYRATIVFIPFGYDGKPTDLEVSKCAMNRMKKKQKVYLISGKYSPQEIMGIISQLDFLIGMRLHSLIMSATQGVPALAISYLPKVKDVLKQLGYKDTYIIESYPLFPNFDQMKKILDNVWQDKQEIKKEVNTKSKTIRTKALESSNLMSFQRFTEEINVSPKKLFIIYWLFAIALILLGFLQLYRSRLYHVLKVFNRK